MLLVIHNLPANCKYADIKALIQSKCGLSEVILDNLSSEGRTKRVTVGLADDGDAAILVRKINGLYLAGQQLYVEDIRQKKESEQPYRSSKNFMMSSNSLDNLNGPYGNEPTEEQQIQDTSYNYPAQDSMSMMGNYNIAAMSSMCYMPNIQAMVPSQNSYMVYGNQQQQIAPLMPNAAKVHAQLDNSFGYGAEVNQDNTRDWNTANNRPDKKLNSYSDTRASSSAYGETNELFDRRSSRWDDSTTNSRQGASKPRGRSPQRPQWSARDRSDNLHNMNNEYSNYPAPMTQNNDLQRGTYRAPQDLDLSNQYSSSYVDPSSLLDRPTSNIFAEPSDSPWGQPTRDQNPFVNESAQSQRGRNHALNTRGGRNPPQRDSSKAYEPRNADRGGPRQPRQADNWRDDANVSQKRGNRWINDEAPQPKKFAQFNAGRDSDRNEPGPQRFNAPKEQGPQRFNTTRDNRNAPGSQRFNAPKEPQSFNAQREPQRFNAPREPQRFNAPREPQRFNAPREHTRNASGPQSFNPPRDNRRNESGPQRSFKPQGNSAHKGPSNNFIPRDRKPEPAFARDSNRTIVESAQKMINKDETWRGQAASNIARRLLKALHISVPTGDGVFTHLKHSVRARINVMLGDKIVDRVKIEEMYANKFPSSGNKELYKTVVQDLKKKEEAQDAEAAGTIAKGSGLTSAPKPVVPKTAASQGPRPGPAGTSLKKTHPPSTEPKRLPSFPEGDKQTHKKNKAKEKREWHKEENYKLPEDLNKALEDEVDKLVDIFMGECMNPVGDMERPVCEQIADIVSDDFRRIVRIHVSKRLLNDCKNLSVRVLAHIRGPQRPALEDLLLGLGCTELQKSDRKGNLYVAHFGTYEDMDAALALGSAEIEGSSILFKPFQLCGPPPSANVARQQQKAKIEKFLQNQIDKSNEYILQPGYIYDPKAGKGTKADEEHSGENKINDPVDANDDNDETGVEVIENIEDGGVIEDDEVIQGGEISDDDEEAVESQDNNEDFQGDNEGFEDDNDETFEDQDIDEDDLEDY